MNAWIEQQTHPALALLVVAATLMTGFAIGHPIARRLLLARHPFDHAILAMLVGIDLVAMAVATIGCARLPSRVAAIGLLVAGTAAGLVLLAAALRESPALRARLRPRPTWLLAFVVMALPLLPALLPPVAWDDLVYHVEVPRRWIELGHVAVLHDNPYSMYPSAIEMLVTLGMRAGGGLTTAGAWSWAGWVALVATCARIVRVQGGSRAGSAAIAFALTWSHVALLVASAAYVDAWVAVHAGALVIALRASKRRLSPGLGLVLGLAGGVKLTAVALAAIPITMTRWRNTSARSFAVFALVAACAAAPFYARTTLSTGNPFAPMYARWATPGDDAAVARSDRYHALASAPFGHGGVRALLVAPLQWTTDGHGQQGTLGWQWPLLLALAIVGAVRRPTARRELVAGLLLYLAWSLTARQLRFFLPGALLCACAAGSGIASLPLRARRPLAGALVLAALLAVPRGRWTAWGAIALAASGAEGAPTAADVVHAAQQDDYLIACDHLGPAGRTCLVGENRGLYVRGPHVLANVHVPPDRPAELTIADCVGAGATTVLVARPARDPDVLPGDRERVDAVKQLLDARVAAGAATREIPTEHDGDHLTSHAIYRLRD